jgi:hypothetical protein
MSNSKHEEQHVVAKQGTLCARLLSRSIERRVPIVPSPWSFPDVKFIQVRARQCLLLLAS